ncbi:hypothetical protein BGX38DRAFT_1183461, partial [Terfezia claveryi]
MVFLTCATSSTVPAPMATARRASCSLTSFSSIVRYLRFQSCQLLLCRACRPNPPLFLPLGVDRVQWCVIPNIAPLSAPAGLTVMLSRIPSSLSDFWYSTSYPSSCLLTVPSWMAIDLLRISTALSAERPSVTLMTSSSSLRSFSTWEICMHQSPSPRHSPWRVQSPSLPHPPVYIVFFSSNLPRHHKLTVLRKNGVENPASRVCALIKPSNVTLSSVGGRINLGW